MDDHFLAFRSRPGEESLLALLRGNQDRIYNICHQVLRHPQDAEDAAQEVLLEVAGGCARIEDPKSFKSWVYRVALHTALNHKRARGNRAELARRSASMATTVSRSDEAGPELMEALDRLDDDARTLILEHYFEKATLEAIARREGLSVTGIWKRIEQAKTRLKQALIGAGFTVTAANLSQALDAVSPVPAPAGLIGTSVLSKAALVAAGGIVVGTKTVAVGTLVGVAILCLTLGAGGGYWAASNRPATTNTSAGPRKSEGLATVQVESEPQPKSVSPPAVPPVVVASVDRLARFREWHAKWEAERVKFTNKLMDEYVSHVGKLYDQSSELRQFVLGDVDAFLKFAEDPANASCLADLLEAAMFQSVSLGGLGWQHMPERYSSFPEKLMDGLLNLLKSGSDAQKLAVLSFGDDLTRHPAEFLDACRNLLISDNEGVLAASTEVLSGTPLSEHDLALIRGNTASSRSLDLREASFKAIAASETAENVGWLLDQLSQPADAQGASLAGGRLGDIALFGKFPRELEAKAASIVIQALSRNPEYSDFSSLVYVAVGLSGDQSGPVLDAAVAHATQESDRRAAIRVRDAWREGERNPHKLLKVFAEGRK